MREGVADVDELEECRVKGASPLGCAGCKWDGMCYCGITLCIYRIEEEAKRLAASTSVRVNDVRDALIDVVIAHEVAHCLMCCLSARDKTARSYFREKEEIIYYIIEESLATAFEYKYFLSKYKGTHLYQVLKRHFDSLPPGYAGYAEWLHTGMTPLYVIRAEQAAVSVAETIALLELPASMLVWATVSKDEPPPYRLPPLFWALMERESRGPPRRNMEQLIERAWRRYSSEELWRMTALRIVKVRAYGTTCL